MNNGHKVVNAHALQVPVLPVFLTVSQKHEVDVYRLFDNVGEIAVEALECGLTHQLHDVICCDRRAFVILPYLQAGIERLGVYDGKFINSRAVHRLAAVSVVVYERIAACVLAIRIYARDKLACVPRPLHALHVAAITNLEAAIDLFVVDDVKVLLIPHKLCVKL